MTLLEEVAVTEFENEPLKKLKSLRRQMIVWAKSRGATIAT
jgi:hypothetical protein